MDELLGIDLIDCAGDNLAAVAPMVIFPASADKRVITRYGEVTSASFARPGSATYVAASGEVKQVGVDVPRVGSTGWVLEGSAQNINTWSNEFTAARGHTLTDCTTAISTEYILTDINGAPRYAYKLTATANNGRVGKYSIPVTSGTPLAVSVYAKKGKGRGRFTGYDGTNSVIGFFNFDTGAFENITDAGGLLGYFKAEPLANGWYRLSCIWTPKVTGTNGASSIGCELANDWCYISGSQFESNARVATSYIYTEDAAITRASEGADTSGNGLSMPLSQAMVDSLAGELCPNYDFSGTYTDGLAHDWSIAAASGTAITVAQETSDTDGASVVQRVTVAPNSESKNNQITTVMAQNIVAGYTYEVVVRAKRLSGYATPKIFITRGATTQWSNSEEYTLNAWETHTYRFTANTSGAASIYFGLAWNQAGEFLVKRFSIRRVLESGQTNPGEGTIVQWVEFPWDSSVLPNSTSIGVLGTANAAYGVQAIYRSSGGVLSAARITAGASSASIYAEFAPGRYCLISQWSASLGRFRCGIYNPATDTLTWSHATLAGGQTYRGFFLIHPSNRLRWFYGGGNYPIHVGGLRWLNSIGSDAECVRLSKEMLP